MTLEYMPNGKLRHYLEKHRHNIPTSQRWKWAAEAVEGVALLNSYGVFQGDIGPHSLLLDDEFGLRICDFGGSSIDGSRATVAPGVRYRLPSLGERHIQPAMVKGDLFALGSTIYFIATGHEPTGVPFAVPFADAIALC